MRGWKKIFHANGNQKKAGVAILLSDKIDFKIKNVTRDKEGDSPGGAVVKNCLPMQATQVQALVQEDSTCHGATKLVCHNY